jgi:hypothetical protein
LAPFSALPFSTSTILPLMTMELPSFITVPTSIFLRRKDLADPGRRSVVEDPRLLESLLPEDHIHLRTLEDGVVAGIDDRGAYEFRYPERLGAGHAVRLEFHDGKAHFLRGRVLGYRCEQKHCACETEQKAFTFFSGTLRIGSILLTDSPGAD